MEPLLVSVSLVALSVVGSWSLVGELIVTNDWQSFPVSIVNVETFRITTTILNKSDWDLWKFKSGAYLQFYYPVAVPVYSQPIYIPVRDNQPIVYEFSIPQPFFDDGAVVRDLLVKRASRYLPLTRNDMFANWSIKVEEYL